MALIRLLLALDALGNLHGPTEAVRTLRNHHGPTEVIRLYHGLWHVE